MLRVAVCDDQNTELKMLGKLLQHYQELRGDGPIQSKFFEAPGKLLASLSAGERYDLFVLDMMMPEYNGVEVGHAIRNAGLESAIIYITASPDFALDAISVHPEQYLLKPLQPAALFRALDDVLKRMSGQCEPSLSVKTRGGVELLPCRKIVCVEHAARIMRVYAQDRAVLESVSLRVPFETLLEPVLQRPDFLQTHQSYVVNLRHITALLADEIRADNGMLIPISRRNMPEVRQRYREYVSRAAK